MRKQKFNPDNRHKFYHTCAPIIDTPQKQRENVMGRTHFIRHFDKDNRYYVPSGPRGYSKQRDYSVRNEHCVHDDYGHAQNNNVALKKPAVSPRYYYQSSAKSDNYKSPVRQCSSDQMLSDVTSYDETEVSYRGSLVSVASSFDALQDRIQTHKIRQKSSNAQEYPDSGGERRYSRHVYSLYNSDDQKRRHSDVEREIHQRRDERLRRKHTEEIFPESKTKNNTNNTQTLSHSVYNASINSNDNGKDNLPLMLFRKDEAKGSNNSDVVYIPVVILPDKQEKNSSNGNNTDSERVDNEQAFTKRKYLVQHSVAKDTIIENEETINITPDLLYNDTNIMYREVNSDNLFKENNCPLLSTTEEMRRLQDRNKFNESLFTVNSTTADNTKKQNDESTFNNFFHNGNGTEFEKLQDIITYNDCEKNPKGDPFNVMLAKLDKIANPFSNTKENIKPTLPLLDSRISGASWKKNVVQHSQSVQVSDISITTTKNGEMQVSNIPKIITKDGEVQTSATSSTIITKNGEIMSNKLKGEKPGIISEDIILPTLLSKDSKELKEKKHNSGKEHMTKDNKSGSENKFKEIIQEINNLVNKINSGENEPKCKGSEENNCCQRRVCRKENNNSRQTKNKQSNGKKQLTAENLPVKKDYKDVPKNSSYFQQESFESPFRRLFGNDYKMTSKPPYFKTGMYTDSPMLLENTYNWLTEPNKQFIESASSNFRTIPKKFKNNQTAYPFFTKIKKKVLSKENPKAEKSDDKESVRKEDEIEKEEEKEEIRKEVREEVKEETKDLQLAEEKISNQNICKKKEEGVKKTEKSKDAKPEKQIEVNLSLLWDYIIQGFNLYLGKTVHTVLIDGIYTVGTVTQKLQNKRN